MLRFVQRHQNNLSRIILFSIVALLLIPLLLIEANSFWPTANARIDSSTEITFSRPSGFYDEDITIAISSAISNDPIIFTTDGSVPTRTNGTVYSEPLHLTPNPENVATIRARAILPGGELGPISNASYFLGVKSTLPVISLIADPEDLWDEEIGIYVNPKERGIDWERPAEVFYVDQDRTQGFQIPAGLRVHGGSSRDQAKKPLRLYFRSEYGSPRLEYPLFPQSDVNSFKRLILHAGGSEYPYANSNGTLLRNPLVTSLSTQINGLATHERPVLLFINGHLWGIYHIREYTNRHFWRDHYGVDVYDGYGERWYQLIDFVSKHDLRDPDHYAYVQTQIDVENFIDYNVMEFYSANVEWPHFNQLRYRPRAQGGRWHWMFWDEDVTFGLAPYVDVNKNMVQWVLLSDSGDVAESVLLLRKLMENPHFYELFLSRMTELLNTTLAPESVLAHIDALAAELEPNIHYETRRWPSSSEWQRSVEGLRQFARLRPDIMRQHIVEGFNLGGTVQLAINQPASGAGTVAINGRLIEGLPWQGIFFQRMEVRVTAVPQSGYHFVGWDSPGLAQTPIISLTLNATTTVMPLFAADEPDVLQPGDVVINQYGIDGEGEIEGDWIELMVTRPGGVDLRGWRITDNDTKTATDEGSLIFSQDPAFSSVPQGTSMLIVATETANNDRQFPQDDLDALDRDIVLYVGNDNLDDDIDPWFSLGPDDSIVLLTAGLTADFADDKGIAFMSIGRPRSQERGTTPSTFGILQDGVIDGQ